MKNWEMPLINVERFSANEYVATCRQFAGLSGNMYWDVFETDYVTIFGVQIPWGTKFSGNGDGEYQSPDENISTGTNGAFNVSGDVPVGWHTSDLWTHTGYRPWDGSSYASSSGFRRINGSPFKIYVFSSGQAWIYSSDMDTDLKPTVAKNFS